MKLERQEETPEIVHPTDESESTEEMRKLRKQTIVDESKEQKTESDDILIEKERKIISEIGRDRQPMKGEKRGKLSESKGKGCFDNFVLLT
ncbi:hypothetical protein LOAG_12333 [Loa loa]|uniref:Uncharacterized protein n=1 Tax=Loa loa TaxID=7209 RepID=A0A1I7VX47_LOALO|nr:hypothetical protein LOAG_12333 [Loa loa]EFO16176.2 hypothetical protein LOAG_12333 [Loa loa]